MSGIHRLARVALFGSAAIAVLCSAPRAQSTRKPKPDSPAALKALDDKAEAVEKAYVEGQLELADGYEAGGQMDKAKDALSAILRFHPDLEAVKQRLAKIEESVFEDNTLEVEVDVTKGWTPSGLMVRKDEAVRFEATGTYRYIINEELGPNGFPQESAERDMAPGVASGALMGMILPPPRQGQREAPQPGPAFQIGEGREYSPEADGLLLLRINLPPGTKSIGKLKVEVSGNIRKAKP